MSDTAANLPRPLRMARPRLRPDLGWYPFTADPRPKWVAKDPVSLEYFHFSHEEKTVAGWLDGHRTLEELTRLARPLVPVATATWLQGFLGRLESSSLLTSQNPARGRQLSEQSGLQARRSRLGMLTSPLFLQIPLFDPSPWIKPLGWLARCLFHPLVFLLAAAFACGAGWLVVARVLADPSQLWNSFRVFQGESAIWLVIAYVAVKSLHELGHLLACRRWDAKCREAGILMILFVPCFYCDTSDSWKLRNRWARAGIAAAGIQVELVLATLAAVGWLVFQPGLLHGLSAQVMLLCSLGTLLLNGNPLMRYDGYHVLSDLWGVPNLAEQSQEVVGSGIRSWFGLPAGGYWRWDGNPFWLAVYGVAATIYRYFVFGMILLVLWKAAEQMGFSLAALVLGSLTLVGMLVGLLRGSLVFWLEIVGSPHVKPLRLLLFWVLTGLVVGLICWLPLPETGAASGTVTWQEMAPLFASRTGELEWIAAEGTAVAAGAPIARLQAPELTTQILELELEIRLLRERREQLQLLSVDDEASSALLLGVNEQIGEREARREILLTEQQQLTIKAPAVGRFVPAPLQLAAPLGDSLTPQSQWSVLGGSQPGRLIERGTLIGWAGTPGTYTLRVWVPEELRHRLVPGAAVLCRLDSDPGRPLTGHILSIAPEPLEETPAPLQGDSRFLSRRDEQGRWIPDRPAYEVTVQLPNLNEELMERSETVPHDSLMTAHLSLGHSTILQRIARTFRNSLRPGGADSPQ